MPRTAPNVSTRLIDTCARLSSGWRICARARLMIVKASSIKARTSAVVSGGLTCAHCRCRCASGSGSFPAPSVKHEGVAVRELGCCRRRGCPMLRCHKAVPAIAGRRSNSRARCHKLPAEPPIEREHGRDALPRCAARLRRRVAVAQRGAVDRDPVCADEFLRARRTPSVPASAIASSSSLPSSVEDVGCRSCKRRRTSRRCRRRARRSCRAENRPNRQRGRAASVWGR